MEIRNIVDSIECELAAVATSDDQDLVDRRIRDWTAATDLDLTLVRSFGGDGSAKIGAPAGLAVLSATPKLGLSDTDTRTNHIKFANSFQKAIKRYPDNCKGVDPSETGMGLAFWLIASIKAIDKDDLVGVSFTKQFEIVVSASSRFGYTLEPVTNPVSAEAGLGGSHDYTNRFTIALTPPPPPPLPTKPTRVIVVGWQQPKATPVPSPSPTPRPTPTPAPSPDLNKGKEPEIKTFQAPAQTDADLGVSNRPKRPRTPQVIRPAQPQLTPRQRVLQDPELNQMLQRKSPVILAPETLR
ncbi:hypothetical protein [Bradyrhizobium sp. WYCCWR 12699]|uniref:hypothetical protein n=1 Tax=Bradyrhizobium sp. WYCCWR 12699 TaxID=3064203 RepID=UPI0028A3A736|nr:hypothetical protein [Bradyrhizobium sp. WYCCWR 12699]MDT4737254.1 hypothetical protein [Bradyrhizobium sp. WYCCWR 12699]